MKRIVAFILLGILLLGFLAPAVRAEENTEATVASEAKETALGGWLDDHFRWDLVDGTLTITGDGVNPGGAPWRDYSEKIEKVVFSDGILTVAAGSFRDFKNLKEVHFGSSMQEIGDYAFQGCTGIKEIRLPNGFKRFGVSCFEGCTSLTQVYCDGYMPNFRTNCLWNGSIMYIYYHPDRVWKVENIEELEHNFGGRLEVLCQDGTDPIPNDEDAPEPPAPVAETEPDVTEAPTIPETQPPVVTEPVVIDVETVPVTTVAETEPETTAAPTEEPTTEPTEPPIEEETVRGGFIGLALILGVLTFFIVGALIFKIRSSSGRY